MAGSNRLLKEYKEILGNQRKAAESALAAASSTSSSSSPPTQRQEITLFPPDESNLYTWQAFILGPPDTPYADHFFSLKLSVPKTYPLSPPKVVFVTKVCHPNVHFKTGEICLDVLKDAWTPIWTLESTCRAIIALLGAPDATSPLNCDAGNLIRAGDTLGFEQLARMYTLDHGLKEVQLPKTTNKNAL